MCPTVPLLYGALFLSWFCLGIWAFFFFGPAESLLPIHSFWPLLPKLSCLEAGGGKQGFNVISQKTFTHKKFRVNIAAEDFSQLLLGSSGPNR